MHRSERSPAVLLGGHDDADRHEVVDLVEFLAADHHLLVDAPEMLRAPGDLRLDLSIGEPGPHECQDLGELDLAPRCPGCDHLSDLGEPLRVKRLEREVLQLPFDLLDAQAMRQGSVDVPCLLGRPALLPLGHDRQGPHVVEPVCQLDYEHPPVAGHRDEHLAHGGGLLRLLRVETEPVQLRDAVHDRRYRRAELLLDLGETHPGVLHRVVQQGGRRADGVEAEVGDDRGHRDRVRDVGLAREPALTLVRLRREGVCPPYQIEVLAGASDAQGGKYPFDL